MKKESLSLITVKTLLAVVIFTGMGMIIFGGGCIIGEYSKNKIDNKIIEPINQETENCAKEGETIHLTPSSNSKAKNFCCEGLNEREPYVITNDNKCDIPLIYSAICINCPNGKCGIGENKCNCPEDCGETTDTSDWQTYEIIDLVKNNETIEYLKDFKIQNLPPDVYSEQKGETYKFGNYILQFILQPNLNNPLPIQDDIKWNGILISKDNGLSWNKFFTVNNPKDYDGKKIKYNPVGIFTRGNKFYVDIANDRGAGSGEGYLLRYYTEDETVWEMGYCLYLYPEIYFINQMNGEDGIDPFTIVGDSGCVYSPVSLCSDKPFGTAIGSYVYPIDPKYKNIHFLGQLFTAANCGEERLSQIWGVNGENYIFSGILLVDNPSQSLINTLKSIGYQCAEKNFSDSHCKRWDLDLRKTIKVNDLLKLEPYYKNFERDYCINCG